MRQARITTKGATLVELLIVIGILAMLMGLIVPSVIAALRTTRRVACQQNLRTLSAGLTFYAHDHGGWLPPSAQRAGGRDHPEVAANTLFHRLLHYDLPALLNSYVASKAMTCPDARREDYASPMAETASVYSNYIFVWGTVASTPIAGIQQLERAPSGQTLVADLTWVITRDRRQTFHGNHLRTRAQGYQPLAFVLSREDDMIGSQYQVSRFRTLGGLNAVFVDGSSQWVPNQRSRWRDAGPFHQQGAFRSARTYLPSRTAVSR